MIFLPFLSSLCIDLPFTEWVGSEESSPFQKYYPFESKLLESDLRFQPKREGL